MTAIEKMQAAMDRNERRTNLLTWVAAGDVDPHEAQAIAEREGFGPLVPVPDPGQFDPMSASVWTLLMAVSWIAFRNVGAVRSSWPVFLSAQRTWVPCAGLKGRIGYRLAAPEQRYLHTTKETIWGDEFRSVAGTGLSLFDAARRLSDAVAAGRVRVYARDLRKGAVGDVEPVPPLNWPSLTLGPRSSPQSEDAAFLDGNLVYINISVDRPQLLLMFPPLAGDVQPNVESSVAPSTEEAAPEAVEDLTPTAKHARGAKRGQGAKDDETHVLKVLLMERTAGISRYTAAQSIAAELAATRSEKASEESIARRLWRKSRDRTALTDEEMKAITDTKSI